MRTTTAAVLTLACLLLLAGPAGAARPVKGAGYFAGGPDATTAALQVSKSGRSLSTRRGGSYVEPSTADCKLRLASAHGSRVRIRRNGKFSLRRRGRHPLRLRGRFRSTDTAAIKVRARCKGEKVVESVVLHRKFKPGFSGCRSQKAKTLASGPTGRIFQQGRVRASDFGYLPSAYGCLFSVNKRFLLGQDDDSETVGESNLRLFRLAGNYTGFADEETQVADEFACATTIRVVDLSNGKDVRSIGIATVPGDCRQASDLELKSNTSVAWISQKEVWAVDALGKRRLDAGAGIDEKSLFLSGSTLSWLNGGVRKSATLN